MNHRILARSLGVAIVAALTVVLAGAQSGRTDPNQKEWLQLFNGKDLKDWIIKFAKHDLGENVNDTFRVEDGLLKVRYDKWTSFDREFGHIFYNKPFSYYVLAAEYRFVGEQVAGAGPSLAWALRNNGLMLHAPDPKTMLKDQDFPISIEVQLLGGLSDGKPRSTANLCTPGTHVVMNGQLHTQHCTNSTSKTYDGDQWVRVEVLVHGDELIRHMIDGRTVLEYSKPQIGGGAASPTDPKIKIDGTPLTGGYIALQAETAPADFRKVELLNLEGCTDPKARNYKSYFVKSAPSTCVYDKPAGQQPFAKRVVATGLDNPFQMIAGPDGYLWVTERTAGRVTRVNPADGSTAPALTIRDLLVDGPGGLLGMALDPGLLKGTSSNYVYVAYTYDADASPATVSRRTKIVRFTYDPRAHSLGSPSEILSGLPAGTDHQGGRLVFGPDRKLYFSIGDLGANQLANFCKPDRSQSIPTAAQVEARDWSLYEGKILRMNLDGSIPTDNPTIAGVRSHVFSYGHRNPQGLVFAPDGQLYESEHGPNTDDEVNLIRAGRNYGWPFVAGYRDDQSYAFANWSASKGVPCASLTFTAYPAVPPSVPLQKETAWNHPDFTPPLQTFHTVPTGYNFKNPKCAERELYYQCWPTVAPASLAVYAAKNGIPGWDHSLLMPSLKHGTVYRIQLNAAGTAVVGEPDENELFKTVNRYRDVAVQPDGLALFIATDVGGNTQDQSGRPAAKVENPGAILEFRYTAHR